MLAFAAEFSRSSHQIGIGANLFSNKIGLNERSHKDNYFETKEKKPLPGGRVLGAQPATRSVRLQFRLR
jgi:hypothetical protein